jgi:DNA invertase Pin-like site-specific DNA recombinase
MPAAGQPIRYAIYTRQSVDKPADFSSSKAQFDTCHARAQAENLQWVGERFDDRGESGGTLDRPALTRLRKLVAYGGVDRVYVSAIDRLSRRAFDLIALLEEFEKSGVWFHVARGIEPPPGAQARFIRHMLEVFAQFEREMIADRIAELTPVFKRSWGLFMRKRIAAQARVGSSVRARG